MLETAKIGYGYIDDRDPSLKTKTGGKFGLNSNSFITKFELNPLSGKDGTAGDALDITIQVAEKEFNMKIFPVNKVYDKDSNEITDTASEAYAKGFNAKVSQDNAVILHLLKATGVNETQIKNAFATPVTSFADFIKTLTALLPVNFAKTPVDIFLEYQWSIAENQKMTFLMLPKNMKGGYFACPAQQGAWTAEDVEGKLVYRNQNGAIHPFERDKNYMEGPKANQQKEGENNASAALTAAAGMTPGNGAGKQGTW